MKVYNIVRTKKVENPLSCRRFRDVALTYLDKIEQSINRLKEFPNSGTIPRYSVLRKQDYRVLIVEKHLIFYKVNEESKTVIIYAIVDGRREYKNLI